VTALVVVVMTSPLWLGFGALGWQAIRLVRTIQRLREHR
jgi:hypothetical protein